MAKPNYSSEIDGFRCALPNLLVAEMMIKAAVDVAKEEASTTAVPFQGQQCLSLRTHGNRLHELGDELFRAQFQRSLRKEKNMEKRGNGGFETDTQGVHLSLDELRMRMQTSPGFLTLQKLLVIYNFIVHPRPLSQIAMHTGLSESTVYRIISDYKRPGSEALDINYAAAIHVVS
jgi:hypothetical protein